MFRHTGYFFFVDRTSAQALKVEADSLPLTTPITSRTTLQLEKIDNENSLPGQERALSIDRGQ